MVWEEDCLAGGSDCSLLGAFWAQTVPPPQPLRCLLGRKAGKPGLAWHLADLHKSGGPHPEHPGEEGMPQRLKGQSELTCPFGLFNLSFLFQGLRGLGHLCAL